MNTNPQAIKFANEKARVMADTLAATYLTAKVFIAQWESQGVAAAIPQDAAVIDDGSSTDGRAPVKNSDVNNLVAICTAVIAMVETGNTLNQVTAMVVNGKSAI